MLHFSGIGTYIRNVAPKIITAFPNSKFTLLGDAEEIGCFTWSHGKNIILINCRSPIYSISEQFELLRKIPINTSLFWSPHYNIPLFYRGKLIVTVHDIAHLALPETAKGMHKQFYARTMFNSVRKKADAIIFVSEFSRQEFIRLVGQPHQPVYVMHNGVTKDQFNISHKQKPRGKPYLLFVGNVKPHKNIVRLLEAFKLIREKIPHDLLILGKKEGFITGDTKVMEKARELSDRIHFTGEIYNEPLQQWYASAAAFVFPSLYEGFGLSPLEAMACGCPVVVSNTTSLPEVCGDAAYYIDPYDVESIAEGMYRVLTDEPLRRDLIRKGIERANIFSWEKSAREHMKVFEEVLRS
ncbi:MAG: glycosyltransferase family 4 protein [Nitrospirae bacterium]|nr:glycosyltransferase family 4 protein [Nitrospirota bacterium]